MSKPLVMLVDNKPCHDAWPLDRGLQYGDGLFETMLVRAGHIRFLALHRARLELGCQRLGIAADQQVLWQPLQQLAQQHGHALLRLQLTRGSALARGYTPTGAEVPRVLAAVYAAPVAAELPGHVRAIALRSQLGENPVLAGLKHCNRLEQILARQELQPTGAYEGLMASSSGRLISGTMSNVFLEHSGEWVTPAVDRCGVAGVMRAVVLREAQRAGMPVRVADLPLSVLDSCTSMFLTNARLGVLPVHALGNRPLQSGDAVQQLAARVGSLDH